MSWETAAEKLALLEVLVRGTLKRRRAQAAIYDTLAGLPWTRSTGRRHEIALVEKRRGDLVALLDRVWPAWGDELDALLARGLPPTPDGWSRLEDARRGERLAKLPELLNRRTAAALAAPHSKATLTARRLAALRATEATHDGAVRLRPPRSLVARSARGAVDLAAVADVLGEVSIPDRAFKEGLVLQGELRAVLLIENLGAWRDMPSLDGWLYAHVPGWNTATVTQLIERLERVPLVHFGDLDPNGVRIVQSLRARRPDLRWLVPSFWGEAMESKGQAGTWPDNLDLSNAPPLVRELAARNLWLEQEVLVVDPRIASALEAMV